MGEGTTEPLFEIETQSASSISNVGGDQNVYFGGVRSRAAAIGRGVAALGLALFFGGVGLFIATVVISMQRLVQDINGSGISDNFRHYVPDISIPALALLAAGIILVRFGRLYANR
jgi:hypothetical protein